MGEKEEHNNGEVAEAADTTVNTTADMEESDVPKKKKKNKKNKGEEVEVAAAEITLNTTAEADTPKKKKKKSKVPDEEVEANGDVSLEEVVPAISEKRKRRRRIRRWRRNYICETF